jgi:hypothetical protein
MLYSVQKDAISRISYEVWPVCKDHTNNSEVTFVPQRVNNQWLRAWRQSSANIYAYNTYMHTHVFSLSVWENPEIRSQTRYSSEYTETRI